MSKERMFLRWTNCLVCTHGAKWCDNYESCYNCPMGKESDGMCLCMKEATHKEKLTGKCKYFEEIEHE